MIGLKQDILDADGLIRGKESVSVRAAAYLSVFSVLSICGSVHLRELRMLLEAWNPIWVGFMILSFGLRGNPLCLPPL